MRLIPARLVWGSNRCWEKHLRAREEVVRWGSSRSWLFVRGKQSENSYWVDGYPGGFELGSCSTWFQICRRRTGGRNMRGQIHRAPPCWSAAYKQTLIEAQNS